ncbi:hypothetical protein [Aurantiacibacter marinus]|uniref:hypothetical protein n=1 Tax=Aurantiacibacter marinus TaxID=874156 RepID=UPI000A7206EA|nr:hypothetical protein [Aurantiacibacter marinus]
MFNHSFFSSKVGHAAMVSVMAMVAFTVFAQMQSDVSDADAILSLATVGELA